MKKFLQKILLFIWIPIVFIGTNLIVDPSGLFIDLSEPVEHLKNNNHLGSFTNYDERSFVKEFLKRSNGEKYDIVVLGSSRSFQINTNSFKEKKRLLNLSLSQARLQDLVTIYYLLKINNITYDTLIISIDPDYFFGKPDYRWRSYERDYLNALNEFKIQNKLLVSNGVKPSALKQMLSTDIFKLSIRKILQNDLKHYELLEDSSGYKGSIKCPDGSLLYPMNKRNSGDKENISQFLRNKNYFVSNDIIVQRKTLFESMVEQITSTDKEIIFYLSPFSPRLFTINSLYKNNIELTETYLKVNLSSYTMIGGFNLNEEYPDSDMFYDLNHPKRSLVNELFAKSLD
ncbi:hypothetical protein [Ekhidna lutea]|nr:hypothetical protein [Ekhidna lutea]